MKRFYFFGASGALLLFLVGWMLNCSGVSSSPTPEIVPLITSTEIISSDWIKVNHWVSTSIFGMPARSCEIYHKHLTNNMLERNKLYIYSQTDNEVHPIPYTSNEENIKIRYDYTLPKASTLRIVAISLNGNLAPISEQKYRYVLVPNKIDKTIAVNMSDFEAVKVAFRLRD